MATVAKEGIPPIRWSGEVQEVDWIARRLLPFNHHAVGSVIPTGFSRYARILHPAWQTVNDRSERVRWSSIAAWSGVAMHPKFQFHSIAQGLGDPSNPAPWDGRSPRTGSLEPHDASELIGILSRHTSTPNHCWFCIWEGWRWLTEIAPAEVLNGPKVKLPNRSYFLYSGPIHTALALVGRAHIMPNLWWPADHSWCVTSEIDLPWSYVGGSSATIDELTLNPRIEAVPTNETDIYPMFEEWLQQLVDQAAEALLSMGRAVIATPHGILSASFSRRRYHPDAGWLIINIERNEKHYPARKQLLKKRPGEDMKIQMVRSLTSHLIKLAVS